MKPSTRLADIDLTKFGDALPRLQAIIAREVRSRFTGDVLGYAWAYLTPLAWIAVIFVAFQLLGRRAPIDTDVVSFILSGIVPYLAFRYTIGAIIRARTAYRHIVTLPRVSPPLVYAAVSTVEFYNALAIFAGLLTANFLIFGYFEVADPLEALLGFALACGTGAAFGFLVASLARDNELAVRITPILLRPLFYLSAVFYTANELPPSLVQWIVWNPLLHAVELTRSGMFLSYESDIATAWIPLLFILVAIAIGLAAGGQKTMPTWADERPL